MKLKILHIWILTSILVATVDLIHGIILGIATLTILIQDYQIDQVSNIKTKRTGGKK